MTGKKSRTKLQWSRRTRDPLAQACPAHGARRREAGMTMVELLVTMSIMGVLMALAVPSFRKVIQSGQVANVTNTFLADMRMARSEAVKRSATVVMCRSALPEAATPACATGASTTGWITGWIVFVDSNNNGDYTAGEPLLRVQSAIRTLDSMAEGSGNTTAFPFTGLGRLRTYGNATKITVGGSGVDNTTQRTLCIDSAGRPRIAGDGTAVCSGTDS